RWVESSQTHHFGPWPSWDGVRWRSLAAGSPAGQVAYGALAQLGEHLLCKQGVVGSIPTGSTTLPGRCGLQRTRQISKPSGSGAVRCSLKNKGSSERLRRSCPDVS